MSTVRDYRLSFEPQPQLRDFRLDLTGTGVVLKTIRDYRFDLSGTAGVLVAPLAGQTVEPESTVTVSASLLTAGPADSWSFRRVSGPSIGISGTGASRTFAAPSQDAPVNPAVPPQPSTVVVGVTATKDGVTSAERTCAVTIMPQTRWVWNGTKLVGAKST